MYKRPRFATLIIAEQYLENLQANKSLFMKLTAESQRLKLESQKKIQDKRHAFQDMIRALIDGGIREGVFRKVDSLLAVGKVIFIRLVNQTLDQHSR